MEPVPFLSLSFQHGLVEQQVQQAIMEVYNRNSFVLGKELGCFEEEFATFCGVPFCAGVGSGLDAVAFALQALGISAKDDVIVPSHTYIATWLAVSKTGARLVPVEPDLNTFNLDVTRIEEHLTSRTRVILSVHLYGQPCDMGAIDALARRHNLRVVEDNAQAHGARWLEKVTGSFGHINATSFHPTQNLGALGDGGAITTADETLLDLIRCNRNYGFKERNISVQPGSCSRLDELQAAVLRIKLRYLDAWNTLRREIAAHYLAGLRGVGDLILPLSAKEAYHVYHLFVIRTNHRDKLKAFLEKRGIETRTHYPIPPHLQKTYRDLGFKQGAFPFAERIAETALSLPLWPGMGASQTDRVMEAVRQYFA